MSIFNFLILLGTHSNCPSKLENEDGSLILLSEYLKQKGDGVIGETISKHFYDGVDSILKLGDLPFLFKVLSINQALSIQAHPNKILARELHQRDPKNYPDSNHKPEMLIALNDFEAMCGFRLANEILEHFASYPELVELCDKQNCDEFTKKPDETNLRKCFGSMMNKSEKFVTDKFQQLKQRIESHGLSSSVIDKLFLRLAGQYPNDVGCFSIYLLNCLKLQRGEAIFLAANIPHAYLFGDGVECMATSDNVVRAGLTPKFKDVNVLCDMLDYSMRSAQDNKLNSTKTQLSNTLDYLIEFRPSVDEFSVQQIKIETSHASNCLKFLIPKCESGSILIVSEISDVIASKSYFTCSNAADKKKFQHVTAGLVYFIDAMTDVYFVIEFDEQKDNSNENLLLLAYRAYSDIKN